MVDTPPVGMQKNLLRAPLTPVSPKAIPCDPGLARQPKDSQGQVVKKLMLCERSLFGTAGKPLSDENGGHLTTDKTKYSIHI